MLKTKFINSTIYIFFRKIYYLLSERLEPIRMV